jgi:redox-sensing transcriptional repressor
MKQVLAGAPAECYHFLCVSSQTKSTATPAHDLWSSPPMTPTIPDIVISRLPVYLRALERLSQEGSEVTSSHELGRRLGISSAQIRKDLSHFGGFGKQGTGYRIAYLREQLRQVLKVEREWEVALVGAGDLGSAVARYKGFADRGFHITCVFDSAPEKVGKRVAKFTIQPMEQLSDTIRDRHIKIAMIAVPAEYAQSVADQLIACGVQAILNYAPINLKVPEQVHVQYIDPVLHLQRMTYYLPGDE